MDSLQEQNQKRLELADLLSQLNKVNNSVPLDVVEKNRIEAAIQAKNQEIADLEQQKQIEQAHEERVTQAVAGFDDVVDKMDFGGLTLRQVMGDDDAYNLVKIEFKKFIQAQADTFSKQIADIQTAASDQKRAADDREAQFQKQNETLQQQLYQTTLDLQDAQSKRDAAAKELDDAKKEVERLNGHVDDLRKEIAVGASGAIKLVNTDEEEKQKKAYADKIKRERTVYGVEWVDPIKKTMYKAKLAATGEEIEYSWTVKSRYFEIQESEVSQFRSQYATEQQPAAEVPPVDPQPVQNSVTAAPEASFPGSIEAPTIPTAVTGPDASAGTGSAEGQAGQDGSAPVSRAEHEELKQRVAALETKMAGSAA